MTARGLKRMYAQDHTRWRHGCTNQQPPQQAGAVPDHIALGRNGRWHPRVSRYLEFSPNQTFLHSAAL